MIKKSISTSITAIVLASSLLAGCAGMPVAPAAEAPAESAPAAETAEPAAEPAAEEGEPAEEAAAEEAAEAVEAEEAEGDITDIKVVLWSGGAPYSGFKEVQDAMNEITEKTIGVHAELEFVEPADYKTQIGLRIAAGETIDLAIQTGVEPVKYSSMYASNQLVDITDILDEEGKEIKEMMGDYLDATTINGRIYGIPTYRDYGQGVYLIMRQDVLDDLGLAEKADQMTTWAELEEIYDEVLANTDLNGIGGLQSIFSTPGIILSGDSFADSYTFDTLGDSLHLIYSDNEGNVSLLPENEDYKQVLYRAKDWYDRGYVHKDSLISPDGPDNLMKGGVIFSNIQPAEYGVEVAKESSTGYDVKTIELNKIILSSANVAKVGVFVPITAAEPEAAIRWINAVYTDPALENLIIWGIEGRDYVMNDAGFAAFPEGQDINTSAYHYRDFIIGNNFNAYAWDGSEEGFRENTLQDLNAFEKSPYLGFGADMSGLENLITGLTSVHSQYGADIQCGNFTDEYFEEYISALKTAGADEYIEAIKTQLDAWKEANN